MEVKEFCDRYALKDRFGTNSLKWDKLKERFGDDDLIPMWVADMDFKVPECVVKAINDRAANGVFGYAFTPDSYYEAVADWEWKHFGYKPDKDKIRVTHGVVSALFWSVDMYTKPEDAVIILTPVYNQFAGAANINGRKLISCDLNYNKGVFTFDAARFEKDIAENDVKLYIMCSPHNPAGRVWTEDELVSMLDICRRHGVLVVSDEIHQDLVFGEHKHIPSASVAGGRYNDMIITLNAASKTFNLATCLTSSAIIENDELLKIWDDFTARYFHVEDNVFGLAAVEAALKGGEDWYDGMKKTIWHNYEIFKDALGKWPDIYVSPLEGTYLMFVDFRKVIPADECRAFIQDKCRIAANYGENYGENFKGFVRFNLAAPPETIKKAIDNIVRELKKL